MQASKRFYYNLNLKEISLKKGLPALNDLCAGMELESITKPSKACIYGLYSLKDDKIYIGSTADIKKRICAHRSNLRASFSDMVNIPLLEAFYKWGEDNIIVVILEECQSEKEELEQRENFWMQKLKPYLFNTQTRAYKANGGGTEYAFKDVADIMHSFIWANSKIKETKKKLQKLGYKLELRVTNI